MHEVRPVDLGIDLQAQVQEMTGWTATAQQLADDIREPGFSCAALNASAWAAGVNPDATAGLIGAANALTSGDCGAHLWVQADPCPSDSAMLTGAAELEGSVSDLLKYASDLARGCRSALAAAGNAAASAIAALDAATTAAARNEAQGALSAAQAVIADCEAALEIIDDAGRRLEHAVNCLRKVPDDLAGTYETPYRHVRDGGTLPYSGDFLGGIVTTGAQ